MNPCTRKNATTACKPSTANNSSTMRFERSRISAGSTERFKASDGFPTNSLRKYGNASDSSAVRNKARSDGKNTAFSRIR